MDSKYQIPKSEKPKTKQEHLALEIEALVKRRDASSSLQEKADLNAQITKLFAQYQRLNI